MAVSLIDVSYSYDGQKKVLDGFSFEFPEKGAVCLMGPSGCGKTTLLRILAGLERPQRGTVEGISGKKPSYVFQENRLLPWLTAVENVAVAAAGENKHSEAESLLKRMGLAGSEHKYPKELSGGMKKRVSIARALAAKGDFLILDEPF
ncbi:MAG TPA: ATP-binding cassette domain-containing protein, partial [Candidatus Avimonas sp.]|nr:ATP-binding cassette domain-containing protein [Candidatus Avimonas sp.]